MIYNLSEKLKTFRQNKNLTLNNVQNISYDCFNEAINLDYLQHIESNEINDIEVWTLFKLASIYETDIFFSNNGIVEVFLDDKLSSINYGDLIPCLDKSYPKFHRNSKYKEHFFSLIGEYISSSRKELGYSQIRFSEYCFVSRATIQRIELNENVPRVSNLLKILVSIFKLRGGN